MDEIRIITNKRSMSDTTLSGLFYPYHCHTVSMINSISNTVKHKSHVVFLIIPWEEQRGEVTKLSLSRN